MAPLPVIDDVYRCTLNWETNDGHTAHNVLHVVAASSDPESVQEKLDEFIQPLMWAPISDQAGITSVDILPLDGASATTRFDTDGTAHWNGNSASDYIPQVAGLIHMPTAQRGPSHRGRVFLPFIGELGVTNGLIDALESERCETAWQNFVGGMSAGGAVVVIASYTHATVAAVTVPTMRRATATQRRRMRQFVNA